jgi:hypothetical protein
MRGQFGLRPRARQNGRVLQRILQRAVTGGSGGLNAGAAVDYTASAQQVKFSLISEGSSSNVSDPQLKLCRNDSVSIWAIFS